MLFMIFTNMLCDWSQMLEMMSSTMAPPIPKIEMMYVISNKKYNLNESVVIQVGRDAVIV